MRILNLASIKNYFAFFHFSSFFKSHMSRLGREGHKILWTVINSFSIKVMRFFSLDKRPFNQTFDDQPMLSDVSANGTGIAGAIDEPIAPAHCSSGLEGRMVFSEFPEHRILSSTGGAHRVLVAANGKPMTTLRTIFSFAYLNIKSAGKKFLTAHNAISLNRSMLVTHFISYFIYNIYSRCGQEIRT
jgi:hypothetical protein